MTRFGRVEEQKPIHYLIADALRMAILRGQLRVGDRLPLEEIASEFGVSRMPVREALIRLEKERLVVFQTRRGAQVAGITANQVREITDLRSILEIDALRRAFEHYTKNNLDAVQQILDDAGELSDPDELADLHWRFHRKLYEPCLRPIQLELIDTLHADVDRFFRIQWREAGLRADWIDDHYEILNACRSKNLKKAVALIENHMRAAERRLLDLVDE